MTNGCYEVFYLLTYSCLDSSQSDYVELRDVATWVVGGTRQRQRRLCSTPPGHQHHVTRTVRLLTDATMSDMARINQIGLALQRLL